jgi:predicted RNA binding protein YcfA (HicA-like mRNA interferase family)
MRPRRLHERLLGGHHQNVRFRDLRGLLGACGFRLDRIVGSHHLYVHPDLPVVLNLQNAQGYAKPYQVRQVLEVLRRYDLPKEEL